MQTVEDTRYISLNTQHGVSLPSNGIYVKSYLSHMTYEFTGLLKEEDDILYSHIDIVNCQIPVSFYNINYASNTLKYKVNNSVIKTMIIPVGNYNVVSLRSEMKNQFLSAGYTFVITFNETTNKYTFIHDTFDFEFLSFESTILENIGFDSVASYASLNKILFSEHCVSLIGIKKLKVSSSALATNSVSSGKGGNILGIIPVNAGPRQMLLYNNSGNRKSLLKNKIVDYIDIVIRDENNNYVNFNNVEYSLTLAITTTRILKINTTIPLFSNMPTLQNNQPIGESPPSTEPTATAPFGDDSDLDFFMYKRGYNTG